ncbi:MAG TPA: ABC transporter ATP-binding protein [Acidimicrobiales bacterium]|nr:ABC transporter ATP-binding protein [Acidimicrobiales bacterium]
MNQVRTPEIEVPSHLLPDAEASGGERLIEVRDLHVTFRQKAGDVHAVRGVSFELTRGKTFVLVGESGSGKSVTARSILGLVPSNSFSSSGSIRFDGEELLGRSEKEWRAIRGRGIGIVFQDPTRSLNPTIRVGAQIAEGVHETLGLSRDDASKRAIELLDLVGIPFAAERAHDYPHQLSGGMRQRVMMAIAISGKPKVLIADEPTTALDVTTQAQIMELLQGLQREFDMGLLLITHDMGLAFSYGDEIGVMYAGRIVERAAAQTLRRRVRMPYTRGLLDSVPRITDTPHSVFPALSGRPPDASHLPAGCPFAPRCRYAQDRCREAEPPLAGDEPGQEYACWFPL